MKMSALGTSLLYVQTLTTINADKGSRLKMTLSLSFLSSPKMFSCNYFNGDVFILFFFFYY